MKTIIMIAAAAIAFVLSASPVQAATTMSNAVGLRSSSSTSSSSSSSSSSSRSQRELARLLAECAREYAADILRDTRAYAKALKAAKGNRNAIRQATRDYLAALAADRRDYLACIYDARHNRSHHHV